jgi:hypothetical protein
MRWEQIEEERARRRAEREQYERERLQQRLKDLEIDEIDDR